MGTGFVIIAESKSYSSSSYWDQYVIHRVSTDDSTCVAINVSKSMKDLENVKKRQCRKR